MKHQVKILKKEVSAQPKNGLDREAKVGKTSKARIILKLHHEISLMTCSTVEMNLRTMMMI